jgi:uncharacterized membrane protein YqhA
MANSRSKLEIGVEQVLFGSRWILAPFYLGMVLALSLIDLPLAGNLVPSER